MISFLIITFLEKIFDTFGRKLFETQTKVSFNFDSFRTEHFASFSYIMVKPISFDRKKTKMIT